MLRAPEAPAGRREPLSRLVMATRSAIVHGAADPIDEAESPAKQLSHGRTVILGNGRHGSIPMDPVEGAEAIGHTEGVSDQEDSADVLRLRDAIDPVLLPHGFASGQLGSDGTRAQLIWCAVADDFASRFPTLPPSREPAEGWGTMCTDVVVDASLNDGTWCIAGVQLEADDLGDVLRQVGSPEAPRAVALVGTPIMECLNVLPPLLAELLRGVDGGRPGP